MIKTELLCIINEMIQEHPANIMSMFFVRRSGSSGYKSYQPQISAAVQRDILSMILPVLYKTISNHTFVQYNPVGVADEEMEQLSCQEVPNYDLFIQSIEPTVLLLDLENLDLSKIEFYCIQLNYNGTIIHLFRQFSKLRKLRRGYIARIFNDELVAMEKEFIGIDETADIIVADGDLYILNHVSLERIFNYRDQYLQKTDEAMTILLNKAILVNTEQFRTDCERDVRAMKRITDIMSKDRLPLFFENYNKVPGIVHDLGINLDFNEEGKIVYRDRSQLFPLIYLMSDAYFKSLLAERTGIAKTEEVINPQ